MVATLDAPSKSTKLKILPHLGYARTHFSSVLVALMLILYILLLINSLLFWGDRERNGIYRISVNGTGEQNEILSELCPHSLTLSYKTGNVYTLDSCSTNLKSSRIDGSNRKVLLSHIGYGFVYGSSMFENKLYWSQSSGEVSIVKSLNMSGSVSQGVFESKRRGELFNDMMVVHPSNQPSGI